MSDRGSVTLTRAQVIAIRLAVRSAIVSQRDAMEVFGDLVQTRRPLQYLQVVEELLDAACGDEWASSDGRSNDEEAA